MNFREIKTAFETGIHPNKTLISFIKLEIENQSIDIINEMKEIAVFLSNFDITEVMEKSIFSLMMVSHIDLDRIFAVNLIKKMMPSTDHKKLGKLLLELPYDYSSALEIRNLLGNEFIEECIEISFRFNLNLIPYLNSYFNTPKHSNLQVWKRIKHQLVQEYRNESNLAIRSTILRILVGMMMFCNTRVTMEDIDVIMAQTGLIPMQTCFLIIASQEIPNLSKYFKLLFSCNVAFPYLIGLFIYTNNSANVRLTIQNTIKMTAKLVDYQRLKVLLSELVSFNELTETLVSLPELPMDLLIPLGIHMFATNLLKESIANSLLMSLNSPHPLITMLIEVYCTQSNYRLDPSYIEFSLLKKKVDLKYILLVYYILSYQKYSSLQKNRILYPKYLLKLIPVYKVLNQTRVLYHDLYPLMLALMSTQIPEYFNTNLYLLKLEFNFEQDTEILHMLPDDEFSIVKAFTKAYINNPIETCIRTLEKISKTQLPKRDLDLLHDPTLLISTLKPLYQNTESLTIALAILDCSVKSFNHLLGTTLVGQELVSARLVYESFLIQELFTIISNTAVCKFIHQMFIENTELIRLVHMQGYSFDIIETVVQNIPSVCNILLT
jgi:hypothetical protein